MPVALTDAQVHHIDHLTTRKRRGGEHLINPSGALTMPDADAKLDRLMTMVGDVRVEVAKLASHSDARDIEFARMRADLDEVRARPQGLTGKSLLIALASVASGAAALVSIIDKVHIG